MSHPTNDSLPPYTEIVENVRNNLPEGLDQLYDVFRLFSSSLRRYVKYQDIEDQEHDMFIAVVGAIQAGRLREPDALPSYIHGIAHMLLCSKIETNSRNQRLWGTLLHSALMRKNSPSPEDVLAERERSDRFRILLGGLNARDREILTRFYFDEQTKEQICGEMDLSDTQFRLFKSRAKKHLTRSVAKS